MIFLVRLAGLLACCIGMLLVSVPIGFISLGTIYLELAGEEPVLADKPRES